MRGHDATVGDDLIEYYNRVHEEAAGEAEQATMTLRHWLSGHRILNGLVRPGVSFSAENLAASLIVVFARRDGAIIFGTQQGLTLESLGDSDNAEGLAVPITFAFQSHEAAEAVTAGAHRQLAKAAVDAAGWLVRVSAGQVAAAIKNEARGL